MKRVHPKVCIYCRVNSAPSEQLASCEALVESSADLYDQIMNEHLRLGRSAFRGKEKDLLGFNLPVITRHDL